MKSAWATVFSIFALCAVVVAFVKPEPLCADSWPAPFQETYLSECGQFRLIVDPAPDTEVDAYYDSQHTGFASEQPHANAKLEARIQSGGWETTWQGPLENVIAPTHAMVKDDGRYVVTFDNWYSTGHGKNVLVIYREDGSLVRSMELTDIVPQYYKDTLPHSVSSVNWLTDALFVENEDAIILEIDGPGSSFAASDEDTVFLKIELDSGEIVARREPGWSNALSEAGSLALEQVNDNIEYQFMLRNPITAPESCEVWRWRNYLREASERERGDGAKNVSPTVLLPFGAEDHKRTFANFKTFTTDRRLSNNHRAVAAPCAPDVLIAMAREIAEKAEGEEVSEPYSSVTLYISTQKGVYEEVANLLSATGMMLVWLDPNRPIPQIPARMPDNLTRITELREYKMELEAEIRAQKSR
ncbi:hypothetical protein EH31_15345 [Erythrobacter longus]|uniref:Uncharacterized protein n=1 Tax=Erythrobacter longus TaxID=1044 RepID=A0A074M621_ERYLO|nr:hypothetical protein [Erythrobacter longus]KEO88809.1 hypothetical protein EH31_15345 [Erythrobacter longus]